MKKLSRTISEYAAAIRAGEHVSDDHRPSGPFSGHGGKHYPDQSGTPNSLASAVARADELRTNSSEWFRDNTTWDGVKHRAYYDPNAHPYSGVDLRVRDYIFTKPPSPATEQYVMLSLPDPANSISHADAIERAMDTTGKLPRTAMERIPEDRYLENSRAIDIREALKHWNGQHDYPGSTWEAVELFCYELCKVADVAAVESAGWYKYPSSTRHDQDGKDWRYITPEGVVINCHSLLHDGVWTMNTTVYSTMDVDVGALGYIHHPDHMTRTLLLTLATVDALSTHGYNYRQVRHDLRYRLDCIPKLWELFGHVFPRVLKAYRTVKGHDPNMRRLSIGLTNILAPDGKIAVYQRFRDEDGNNEGAIGIRLDVFDRDPDYLRQVLTHELVHYVLETPPGENSHGPEFQEVARLAGVEKQHRD